MQSPAIFVNPIDNLMGFLTFDLFISPAVFFLAYYSGAIIIPLLIYQYVYRNIKNTVSGKLPEVDKAIAVLAAKFSAKWLFLMAFILFEIFWRILFEFIIAYFQIRDALVSINIAG